MSSIPQYAFCESVYAGPQAVEHIRVVGPEGLKIGGGVKGPTLCGRTWPNGWDVAGEVNAENVFNDHTCRKCAEQSMYNQA
ncbi:hypothetical protein [Kineosporia succinea]|uniref:Uncharacterized protein n=1 Tax=Kineosporia succinea TaxID=84632 RepID=A0ABT9P9N4_9ACTN|nr:hypothetical protein [Kineosporia succinea]MDP9829402.1 hypothetical protein [Kineosporia succinea]